MREAAVQGVLAAMRTGADSAADTAGGGARGIWGPWRVEDTAEARAGKGPPTRQGSGAWAAAHLRRGRQEGGAGRSVVRARYAGLVCA